MTTRIEKLQAQANKLNETLEALRGTFAEKAEALQAVNDELNVLLRIENVQQGDTVTFAVGRKEDRKEVTGQVLGVKDDEAKGKLLRVYAGEGFDAQTYVIQSKDVLAVGGNRFEVVEPVSETADGEAVQGE